MVPPANHLPASRMARAFFTPMADKDGRGLIVRLAVAIRGARYSRQHRTYPPKQKALAD